ncbi:diguanylate cyclase [Teredinibacter haidensis]|uniref:diguanylate cyclase n=1 Tax=Teredinibacter haidensis TaxID=2731755 RepID=UPI000948DF82|nr:diguanylate cyclase [Teredinibacter haidensis]
MDQESYTLELLKNTLDALPDGILIVSRNREIVYCNHRFREQWNIPKEQNIFDENAALLEYALSQVEDPSAFVSQIERLHNSTEMFEDELKLLDGRYFSRRSVSFTDDRIGQSRIWIFTEITHIKESEKDVLTHLLNRRKFETEFLSSTLTANGQSLLGVAMLDIDYFKQYNDTCGHYAGDDVLRNVGKVITEHLQRQSDRGYRIGGDEFILQCNGHSRSDIIAFIEGIRLGIENLAIPSPGNKRFDHVTASIGLCIVSTNIDAKVVYQSVDKLLYQSKALGRNRVTIQDIDD